MVFGELIYARTDKAVVSIVRARPWEEVIDVAAPYIAPEVKFC
jgi:hypothetical protein